MKQYVIFICTLLISMLLTVSCSGGGDDGVVIVPSDRGSVTTSDMAEVTVPQSETESESDEITVTETGTESAETVLEDGTDTLDKAQQMLEDEAFQQYLEQYGISADNSDVLGAIAAVLSYQDAKSVDTDVMSETAVYWTTGGSVWHTARECSALAKSKSVQSGDEAQALAAGKTRACKRCAG